MSKNKTSSFFLNFFFKLFSLSFSLSFFYLVIHTRNNLFSLLFFCFYFNVFSYSSLFIFGCQIVHHLVWFHASSSFFCLFNIHPESFEATTTVGVNHPSLIDSITFSDSFSLSFIHTSSIIVTLSLFYFHLLLSFFVESWHNHKQTHKQAKQPTNKPKPHCNHCHCEGFLEFFCKSSANSLSQLTLPLLRTFYLNYNFLLFIFCSKKHHPFLLLSLPLFFSLPVQVLWSNPFVLPACNFLNRFFPLLFSFILRTIVLHSFGFSLLLFSPLISSFFSSLFPVQKSLHHAVCVLLLLCFNVFLLRRLSFVRF